MILFQDYFEKRVEELLACKTKQTFYVFRGFGIEQIQYLINHNNSILFDEVFVSNEVLNIERIECGKRMLNKRLITSEESLVGFYEELIAISSVVRDLSVMFDGDVVIVNNNLFGKAIPSCLDSYTVSQFFDYMQSDHIKENPDMELLAKYYSDARVIDGNNALLYPINVHKDLELPIVDFFEDRGITQGTYNNGEEIQVGTEKDQLYRLAIMKGPVDEINIMKDISELKGDSKSLQIALQCLEIPYSLTNTDLRAPEFEYDDKLFLPYLKKYWGQSAEFRKLEFYKEPCVSKEIKIFSQGAIVNEIVEQCELACDGDTYRDIFITAPTGSGKSLLFQLPALYISERYQLVTIVISPLIALMNDQVAQLERERGTTIATCINSSISFEERQKRIEEIRRGKKSIVYLAPELLLATGIKTLLGERKLGLLVIDEVHTVTSWGRDFRSDYWFLGDFLKMMKKLGEKFPILCLTATAVFSGVDDVVNDTILELDLDNPILHLGNVKRTNINFDIVQGKRSDKEERLDTIKSRLVLEKIRKFSAENQRSLIYCPYRS